MAHFILNDNGEVIDIADDAFTALKIVDALQHSTRRTHTIQEFEYAGEVAD